MSRIKTIEVRIGRKILAGPKFWTKKKHLKNKKSKKIFYIIRRGRGGAGFFSNYMYVLGHICYALDNEYIPVVDMKNYKTLYTDKGIKENIWNNYFVNVSEFSLEDAYKSKNYILSENKPMFSYVQYKTGLYLFPTEETVEYFKPIINSRMKIREEIQQNMQEVFNTQTRADFVNIGCHIRGTDMKSASEHPIPRKTEDYITEIKSIISDNKIKKYRIFLATDEIMVVDEFKKNFMENVWCCENYRAKETESNGIHMSKDTRDKHKYLLGLEVLRDAYFLSKCDYLVCGYSNISNVAILWNGNNYNKISIVKPESWN